MRGAGFEACGAGFMLLRRSVVERMTAAALEAGATYWPSAPGVQVAALWNGHGLASSKGRFEGEDYSFCRRWREFGGEIFTDTPVTLGHVGGFTDNRAALEAWQLSLQSPAVHRGN